MARNSKWWIGLFFLWAMMMGSCSLSKPIKDGRTAHQQKQYAKAVEMLTEEIGGRTEGEEYAELSYLLGESYKYLNDSENSLKWYIEAAKNDYGPESYYEMAYMLKKNERYQDAITTFQRLGRLTQGRENEIRKEIDKCRQALRWSQNDISQNWEIDALPINSEQSDYAPYLLDNQYLVFTSDRLTGDTYEWTGNGFSDLYVYDIEGKELIPFTDEINTAANEGTACFNADGTEIFFTRCYSEIGDSYCRIYRSELINGKWSEAEEPFSMKPRVNYGDPVLIKNDSILIFTSDDPTGVGAQDLYYSLRLEDNAWTNPDLMPSYLNTIGEERFPRWDGESLYYSSDFLAGLGGLDIFKTTLNPDRSWTNPENMMAPINSAEDDYAYVEVLKEGLPDNMKKLAFFTTTRGVFGNDDIYQIAEYKKPEDYEVEEEPEEEIAIEEPDEAPKDLYLLVTVVEKIYAVADNPNSFVVGKRPVAEASVKFTNPQGEELLSTKEDGTILVPIDTSTIYGFLAGKRGYLNNGVDYQITEDYDDLVDDQVLSLEIEIDQLFTGVDITLENIYYDYNQSYIRDDAKPSLNALIKILKDNPAISIQLASHTDCRGEDDYNLQLSKDRAASAISYIQEQGGIDADRLSSIGYGETLPEITCECDDCTEEEHQINRRTTFRVE